MKVLIDCILIALMVAVITLLLVGAAKLGMYQSDTPKDSSKPKLVMDSVCATPNGHPVYKYVDNSGATIYVIVSASNGYPISMQVK